MEDIYVAAHELGMDHAERSQDGEPVKRLLSGRQVALALGLNADLPGDDYVRMFEAYGGGWSDFW